jgi:hypothetical protein
VNVPLKVPIIDWPESITLWILVPMKIIGISAGAEIFIETSTETAGS